MDRDSKNAAIAALCIILLFGVGAYYMPSLMLALGKISTVLAGVVAVAFVAAFFLLFWLRGRSRRNKAD